MKHIKPFNIYDVEKVCNGRHRSVLESAKILEKKRFKEAVKDYVSDEALVELLNVLADKCFK